MQVLSFVWDGSPILADLGAIQLRWYSLLFAGGIIFSYIYLKKYIVKEWQWEDTKFDKLATYIILGTIIGARVGELPLRCYYCC